MKKSTLGLLCILLTTKTFALKITSTSIQQDKPLNEAQVANNFGCHGNNLSPELSWSDAPKDTKSFAVTLYDPDAPTGSGFWHWVVYDINKNTNSLIQGSSNSIHMPNGSIEAMNDAGVKGYLGACPPHSRHRYIFTVYALNTDKLPINSNAAQAVVRFMIMAHTIDKKSITTYYTRP